MPSRNPKTLRVSTEHLLQAGTGGPYARDPEAIHYDIMTVVRAKLLILQRMCMQARESTPEQLYVLLGEIEELRDSIDRELFKLPNKVLGIREEPEEIRKIEIRKIEIRKIEEFPAPAPNVMVAGAGQ